MVHQNHHHHRHDQNQRLLQVQQKQTKIHQITRERRRPFLSCTISLLIWSLGGLIVVYIGVLLSFFFSGSPPQLIPSSRSSSRYDDNSADSSKRTTIGVASTVTSCSGEPFVDGAAVLKYSLDLLTSLSSSKPPSTSLSSSTATYSKYDYQMYIMYHPNATECVAPLKDLGFTLLERDTPIRREDIGKGKEESAFLRERIAVNGCCGELELIKLEAFTLIQHPVVIHIDLDTLILKPLDGLIDLLIQHHDIDDNHLQHSKQLTPPPPPTTTTRRKTFHSYDPTIIPKPDLPIMWPDEPIPKHISLLFTKDYNVVAPKRQDKPYQGGFFMIKPSIETYNEFLDVLRKGDYHPKKGWGGYVGPFYGGMTIQGLLPYFYDYIHPGQSVELNRCIVNNMSDRPNLEDPSRNFTRCRTNQDKCEDCRERPAEDVMTFHFTICQKPWKCLKYKDKTPPHLRLCREMNRRWYEYRSQLETSWGRNGSGNGALLPDHYRGYCHEEGHMGYQKIQTPYGFPIQ